MRAWGESIKPTWCFVYLENVPVPTTRVVAAISRIFVGVLVLLEDVGAEHRHLLCCAYTTLGVKSFLERNGVLGTLGCVYSFLFSGRFSSIFGG